jgi:predicted unusual protein kinase regulating ubiquinone biosynthesis (AarF/ABC1/UbiB family)
MIKRILGASSLCISTIGIYKYNTDSDVKRAITLYKELGPVISHYRYVEFKQKYFPPSSAEEGELEFSLLHEKYSTPVLETLRDLRGFYIKVGQIMANRSDVLVYISLNSLKFILKSCVLWKIKFLIF